jgi:CMP-N,N'-diacetyllegionaminic acid synthase
MVLRPGGQVVAVVPARAGSKGIPRKNLARVAGRPLIAWSIDAGLAATSVDRVVVSTDDEEIAEVARACGAEVPFLRPSELARDDTPDLPVFQHLLDELDGPGSDPSRSIELLVHLRPTSPLRPQGLIDEGIRLLRADTDADSVRSLSAPPKTPYKMWRVEHGVLEPLLGGWDRELFNQPRQQLPEVWVHDGVLDVVRASVIQGGSMCGRRVLPLFTPPGTAIDIDTPDDLDRAGSMIDPSER